MSKGETRERLEERVCLEERLGEGGREGERHGDRERERERQGETERERETLSLYIYIPLSLSGDSGESERAGGR